MINILNEILKIDDWNNKFNTVAHRDKLFDQLQACESLKILKLSKLY